MENKQIDILDVLIVLAKKKWFIISLTLIISVAAIIYSLVTPEIWNSTATIIPIDNEVSSFSYSSTLSGLQSSLLGVSSSSSASNLITVMNSRTFSEDVIDKFNLIEYFEISDPDSLIVMHEVLKSFNSEMRSVSLDEETGLIVISIKSKNKFLSSDIANYYVEKIERHNLENRMSKGREKRIFIENRIEKIKVKIEELSQMLLDFQVDNKVIGLSDQVKAVIDIYAKLEAERTTFEMEKEYLQKTIGTADPKFKVINERLKILNTKITELKEVNSSSDYLFSLDNIADIGLGNSKIKAELEIQQQLYEFLYPQLENAKIEEIKDLATIEVIDIAKPAGQRSKPKRGQLCIIAFILAIIFSSILVLFHHLAQRQSAKLTKFKNELFS